MNNPKYKYEKHFEDVKIKYKIPCPCIDAKEKELGAFRWVKDEIITSDDFIPNQIERLNSSGKFRPFPPGDNRNCKIFGLSLFNSEEKARSRYNQLPPKIQKRFNWVGLGTLNLTDGKSTKPEKSGHFTLHEYKEAKLEEKFNTINKL